MMTGSCWAHAVAAAANVISAGGEGHDALPGLLSGRSRPDVRHAMQNTAQPACSAAGGRCYTPGHHSCCNVRRRVCCVLVQMAPIHLTARHCYRISRTTRPAGIGGTPAMRDGWLCNPDGVATRLICHMVSASRAPTQHDMCQPTRPARSDDIHRTHLPCTLPAHATANSRRCVHQVAATGVWPILAMPRHSCCGDMWVGSAHSRPVPGITTLLGSGLGGSNSRAAATAAAAAAISLAPPSHRCHSAVRA